MIPLHDGFYQNCFLEMNKYVRKFALYGSFFLSAVLLCGSLPVSEKIIIYMIGDSTMADKVLDKQNPERGWGQYLPSCFDKEVEVRNYAQNGRSTRSFVSRGLWTQVESRLSEGDYLFLQFGHNDQKQDDPERYAAPYGEYTEKLRLFVRTAQEKGAIPVLLTPIARRHFDDTGKLKYVHGDYPDAMKRVAEECGVLLIDMTTLTSDWLSELGDEASRRHFMWVERGTCPLYPDGKIDNTHLVASGARKVARIAVEEIRRTIPELAAHICLRDIVVAKDGSGDFFTVQEAVNAAPDYPKEGPTTIYVRNGIYREKVWIPASKRNLRIEGEDAEKTVIVYGDYADRLNEFTDRKLGTSGSATVYIEADDFEAENITFANDAGQVGQAVAVVTDGDRMVFRGCRFIGNQDTLYTFGEDSRQYYTGCYIEGTTDFIFGFSTAYFYDCTLHSKRNSYVTAASTPRESKYGYVFRKCRLTADEGIDKVYLGRPWRPYANTVFLECELGEHILPAGWHNWRNPDNEKTARYAEWGNSGPGASLGGRVKWARILSDRQAARLTVGEVLGGCDGWNPENQ